MCDTYCLFNFKSAQKLLSEIKNLVETVVLSVLPQLSNRNHCCHQQLDYELEMSMTFAQVQLS